MNNELYISRVENGYIIYFHDPMMSAGIRPPIHVAKDIGEVQQLVASLLMEHERNLAQKASEYKG